MPEEMFKIKWYDEHDGRPDYSKKSWPTYKEAYDAAELAIETWGAFNVIFEIVNATTLQPVKG